MKAIRKKIEAELLTPPYKASGSVPEAFPTLRDVGWEFDVPAPLTVPVVETPDGDLVVGSPDERGIVWRAGTAFVVEGGDGQHARQNSIGYVLKCKPRTLTTSRFEIARGFGQTPILLARP